MHFFRVTIPITGHPVVAKAPLTLRIRQCTLFQPVLLILSRNSNLGSRVCGNEDGSLVERGNRRAKLNPAKVPVQDDITLSLFMRITEASLSLY